MCKHYVYIIVIDIVNSILYIYYLYSILCIYTILIYCIHYCYAVHAITLYNSDHVLFNMRHVTSYRTNPGTNLIQCIRLFGKCRNYPSQVF